MTDHPTPNAREVRPHIIVLLGPAFVAAIAYVDPGNVAANISAGAKFGFLLVWVILLANVMAGLVQYLSAVFAVFGLAVGATQHFRGWAKIMSGKFTWGEHWYLNAWMLSGFAILIITALVLLIWRWRQPVANPQ